MPRRFVLATALVLSLASLVHSDTFLARITRVEGNKVTYRKATYHPGQADKYTYDDPVTVEAAKDVVVTRGHFLPAGPGTTSAGRLTGKAVPIEGGLRSDVFRRLPPADKPSRPSLITIADKGPDQGKLTAINLWQSGSPK
jgi:hypothetical protein